jgi:nitrous-oxide reductase
LHTQFDGKGNGYTSLYIESAVAKWKLPPWTDEEKANPESLVLDKIGTHFNIGHLVIGGSDTRKPYGDWLVAMNKLSKGRHLSTGPSQPESSQLIDITGKKMEMVYESFTDPEPHFAQILKADQIQPIEVYPKAESKNPNAIWSLAESTVTYEPGKVTVKIAAVRSQFGPDKITVQEGDTVVLHITNIEQTTDIIHGFAISGHNLNVIIDPGETKSVTFKADKSGVFPFYCTNFCSALHQEMQGYLEVKPAGTKETASVD